MLGVADSIVVEEILVDGKIIADTFLLRSISVENFVDKLSRAEIVFSISEDATGWKGFLDTHTRVFKYESEVEIKVSNDTGKSAEWIFSGIIERTAFSASGPEGATAVVYCVQESVRLTKTRRSEIFEDNTDSDVIKSLLNNSGVKVDKIARTEVQHKVLVQYEVSDWDFILTRASVNDLFLVNRQAGISLEKWDSKDTVDYTLTLGDDIIEIDLQIGNAKVNPSIISNSWDPVAQEAVSLKSGVDRYEHQRILNTPALKTKAELKAWGDSVANRIKLSQLSGRILIAGGHISPGELIRIDDVGGEYGDALRVSGVVHEIQAGGWTTEVSIGVDAELFGERQDVPAPMAAGIQGGVRGLHLGKVSKRAEDPDGSHRVQVDVNLLAGKPINVWARVSQFLATKEAGALFYPKEGDEVLVGFVNNDPNYPVIVGSLYSAEKLKPPQLVDDQQVYLFKSPNGAELRFECESAEGSKEFVKISTTSGHVIMLHEADKKIVVEDQNGGTITLDESGIILKSPKDITLDADGEIVLKAKKDINLKATGNTTIEGMNTDIKAKTAATLKGSASAEISASGQTTVKGAMVMIN